MLINFSLLKIYYQSNSCLQLSMFFVFNIIFLDKVGASLSDHD